LDEENDESMDDFEAPKYLADIFESVAGAIYIDSGFDLPVVWNVYYKILAPYFSNK
jgi:endoribonuclease Dicer